MKYIFIGFYGWPTPPMRQAEKVHTTDEHFECWNLRKFSASEFVDAIKTKIQPINENVLKFYLNNGVDEMGISEEQYKNCLWGLLVPDPADDCFSGYKQVLALLNIFSRKYLRPAFYITNMGIKKVNEFKQLKVQPNDQQGYDHFKTKNFVLFYNEMISQMKYFIWHRDVVLTWSDEDWRIFMAAGFYEGLEEYENRKTSYTWQRESADMAVLLETLFTAGDTQTDEIGYRLRKRIGTLIGWNISDIENEIKNLYKDRSEFIHGSYYKKIIKGMKSNEGDRAFPPGPDFDKLYKTKESIKRVFVAYLYLSKNKSEQKDFATYNNIQSLLEDSILNIEIRQKIVGIVRPIVELLP